MAATTFAPDGTPLYTFGGGVAVTAGTDDLARGVTCVLRAVDGGAAVPMYDLRLQPIPHVRTSDSLGTFPAFLAAAPDGVLDAGSVQLPISSLEAVRAGLIAEAELAGVTRTLQQLVDSLGGYVTEDELQQALAAYTPGTGGGSGDLAVSDFMRLLLGAADGAEVRRSIGAGTSSLTIGTRSTDAKAGDYQPSAANITDATTVGRELVRAKDQDAARTTLGAAAAADLAALVKTVAGKQPAGSYAPANVLAAFIADAPRVDDPANPPADFAARVEAMFAKWGLAAAVGPEMP